MSLMLFNLFSSPATRPDHPGSPGVRQTDSAGGAPPWGCGWLNYDRLPAAGSARPIITLGLPSPQTHGVHSTEPALRHKVILCFVPEL